MVQFRVQEWVGPLRIGGLETVEASDAKEAAVEVCGDDLAESGQHEHLRAEVWTIGAAGPPIRFYMLPGVTSQFES